MSRNKQPSRAVLAGILGVVIAAPVYAEDAPKPGAPAAKDAKATDVKSNVKAGAKPATTTTTAKPAVTTTATQEAVSSVGTWEAYGSGQPETIEETFFRLSRDFASTAEIGVRRVGMVPVWPRGELKFGAMRIFPYLREGFEYDSNFFQQHRTGDHGAGNSANRAAYTWVNQIGAFGDMAFAGGRARLTLAADSTWDVRDDDGRSQDSNDPRVFVQEQDDAWEFTGTAALSYRWPQGVFVRGGYTYEKLQDPIDVEQTGEFPRHNHRPFFVLGTDKDIFFGTKARFEVGVSMRDTVADDSTLDDVDRTETEYYAKVSYPFWKRTTRAFVRARYRQDERESDQINDGNVWGTDFGIEGSIPLSEGEHRGLRGSVSIGFDAGQYEDEDFNNDLNVRDENSDNANLNVQAQLQYMISSKSTADLRFLRSNEFSYHGNYQVVDRFDLTFTHHLGQNLIGRVGLFWEHGDPSGRTAYQSNTVGTDTTGEYPETYRGGGGFGLRYAITDYADLDFSYAYERRNNRITGFTNHEINLGVTFYLNALKPKPTSTALANVESGRP